MNSINRYLHFNKKRMLPGVYCGACSVPLRLFLLPCTGKLTLKCSAIPVENLNFSAKTLLYGTLCEHFNFVVLSVHRSIYT